MIIDRNDLQPYEHDWGEFYIGPNLKKMYETFVCTQSGKVELALKQLYTYLADGVINQERKTLFTLISK